jgi:hypothetical protein
MLGHIDTGQDADAALGLRVADVFQLADDARAHGLQLAFASRRHHHLRAGQGQQTCHRPADAGRATGDQRHLANVQPGDVLGETDHGAAAPVASVMLAGR